MKKFSVRFMSTILVFLLTFGVFSITAFATEITFSQTEENTENDFVKIYGDVDKNNVMNIADATILQLYLVKLRTADEISLQNADVSGDDDVNIDDATLIQQKQALIFSYFPVQEHQLEEPIFIKYDDYYNISSIYSGYTLGDVLDNNINSYRVSKGSKTNEKDYHLTEKINNTTLHAIGTGTCFVDLVKQEDYELYKQSGNVVSSTKIVNLIVDPAPLTMVYVTGQSNAYGVTSANLIKSDYTGPVVDSVLCPRGQVYSTFVAYSQQRGIEVCGNTSMIKATTSNYLSFVPDSLKKSCVSMTGSKLIYPLYGLTEDGKGKTGPDSGFAYEYNRLSGEKVWVVNAAVGASSMNDWGKTSANYTLAKSLFNKCNSVKNAEINAKHYTEGKKIVLWMQGEADYNMAYDTYFNLFKNFVGQMHEDFKYDVFSIILARGSAYGGIRRDYRDRSLTTPRLVQSYFGNSKTYPKVYVVSRCNEMWLSNDFTADYFNSKYPEGKLTYPLRKSSSLFGKLPVNLDIVHYDIHFGPAGHNENGIEAGRNTYNILNNIYNVPNISFILNDGHMVVKETTVTGNSFKLNIRLDSPIEGKNTTYSYDTNVLSYNEKTQTFTFKNKQKTQITINYDGVPIHTFTVKV